MSAPQWRDRAEAGFEAWALAIARRPWRVIALSLVATAALAAALPSLEFDFSSDSFLLPGDDTRKRYDEFRSRFGWDERIVVAVEVEDVFDLATLEKIRVLHREIEREVPYVEEVLSLLNARQTRGEVGELIVEELLEHWPETETDVQSLRETALSNPTYRNVLLSQDGRLAAILVKPVTYSSLNDSASALGGFEEDAGHGPELEHLTSKETFELIDHLHEISDRHRTQGFDIYLVGEYVLGHRAGTIAAQDTMLFTSLSMATMSVILLLLFRRLGAPALSLLVVSLSLVATFGAMAALRVPFSYPTQIIPNFLIAVGICDSVHILSLFYQGIDRGEKRSRAIAGALRHSGVAVALTSLTTAGGLASFLAAEITPVANIGIVAPIGVAIALAYSLTLLPALLVVIPSSQRQRTESRETLFDSTIVRVGDFAARNPVRVLAVAALLALVAIQGLTNLRFSHDPFDWLLESDPVRIGVERMERGLKGTSVVEVLVDTGEVNGLYSPDTLRRIDAAASHAESLRSGPVTVAKASSVVDIVKETHRALNENRQAYYAIPDDRELVAQELLLFENSGSDDVEELTDTQIRTARLTLRVSLADGLFYRPFLRDLEASFEEILGDGLPFEFTGSTVLSSRAFEVVITSMGRSYLLALGIIVPLMVLMIGKLRLGLLSMIPNLLPIYLTLALMGWLDVALNMTTLMVGSIVIGVAVDDTIHFIYTFDRLHRTNGDVRASVRGTLSTTGRALFITSVVLVLTFGIFYFGNMTGVRLFGVLSAFATSVAFLADLLVSPALLALAVRK